MFQLGTIYGKVAIVPLADQSAVYQDDLTYINLPHIEPADISQEPLPGFSDYARGRMYSKTLLSPVYKTYYSPERVLDAVNFFNTHLPQCTRASCFKDYVSLEYPMNDIAQWHYLTHNYATTASSLALMAAEDIYDIYNCVCFAQATYSLDEYNIIREHANKSGFNISAHVDPDSLPSQTLRYIHKTYTYTDFQVFTHGVPLLVVWGLVSHATEKLYNTEDIPSELYPYILEESQKELILNSNFATHYSLAQFYRSN